MKGRDLSMNLFKNELMYYLQVIDCYENEKELRLSNQAFTNNFRTHS